MATNNINDQSVKDNQTNDQSNATLEDKLASIIYKHDLNPEWFYDHCQSGKLLSLQPNDAAKVRACYKDITDNGLLSAFWTAFKEYRQEVKRNLMASSMASSMASGATVRRRESGYQSNGKTNGKPANKVWRDSIIHDQPNVWKYLGVTVIVDKPVKQIKIVDRTMAAELYVKYYVADLNWKMRSGESSCDFKHVIKTLARGGVIAEINIAMASSMADNTPDNTPAA